MGKNGQNKAFSKPLTPFFDPDTGETSFGEVMDDYYRKALQAFNEGKISREEWEAMMVKYFNSFNGNDNN